MHYRKDIDGLRTIAVALVIFNHFGFSTFSGGYVGVDVFFVISGFLITSIIYPKIADKRFSYKDFLVKRIKRLMPVLFFVMAISSIVFTIILLPNDLIKFYKSLIWISLYVGNFFFWREHGGYFDGNSQEAPLLHTWSLAVEEQYYLIWPIMLALTIKLFGLKRTLLVSVLICIICIYLSQLGTELTIGAAYYLLPTRFFELLVGSCLAIAWSQLPQANKWLSNLIAMIGISLILGSAIVLTEHSRFPGYNALPSVIGTALLIYSSRSFINKLLATKPFTFTGAISYSLYLWHWPIVVAITYMAIELTSSVQYLAILVTYILSILSWRFIEQPFRQANTLSFTNNATKYYVVPTCIIALFAVFGIQNKGYEKRFSPEILHMDKAVNSFASEDREGCHAALRNSQNPPSETCIFGADKEVKNADILIVGDSHANHLVPFIDIIAKNKNLTAQDYTMDRCLPIFDLEWGSTPFMALKCFDRNQQIKKLIQKEKFSHVVISASWPEISTSRVFHNGKNVANNEQKYALLSNKFKNTINIILSSGAQPLIILGTPSLQGLSPKCTIRNKVFLSKTDCTFNRNENILLASMLDEFEVRPDTLDVQDLFCSNQHCKMYIKSTPLYRDDNHFNSIGATQLGREILKERELF